MTSIARRPAPPSSAHTGLTYRKLPFSHWLAPAMFALLCASISHGASAAGAAYNPDPDRGRALYENQCRFCHSQKIHSRPNRQALTRAELRQTVDTWSRQASQAWTQEEIDDVVEYLNRTQYHFPPIETRP